MLLQVSHELSIPFSLATFTRWRSTLICQLRFGRPIFTVGRNKISVFIDGEVFPCTLILHWVSWVSSRQPTCVSKRHQEGVPFFQSANEVILSPGINGTVPAKYISQVKDLSSWWRKLWICVQPSLQMVGLHRCLDGAMTTGWYDLNFNQLRRINYNQLYRYVICTSSEYFWQIVGYTWYTVSIHPSANGHICCWIHHLHHLLLLRTGPESASVAKIGNLHRVATGRWWGSDPGFFPRWSKMAIMMDNSE